MSKLKGKDQYESVLKDDQILLREMTNRAQDWPLSLLEEVFSTSTFLVSGNNDSKPMLVGED